MILVRQEDIKMEKSTKADCYQSAVESGQVGNYKTCCCNTIISSWGSINHPINKPVAAADQQFNCKMTSVLGNNNGNIIHT